MYESPKRVCVYCTCWRQWHVIETKFPATLVQDTSLACQLAWIRLVAPVPAVFGFDPGEKKLSGSNNDDDDDDGKPGGEHRGDDDDDDDNDEQQTPPFAETLDVFRSIEHDLAPHALLTDLTNTLQSIFRQRCVRACVCVCVRACVCVFARAHTSVLVGPLSVC